MSERRAADPDRAPMLMGYILRPGTSFCRIGEHHIFLDLRGDRYFGLPGALDRDFGDLLAGARSRSNDEVIAGLVKSGLLVEAPGAILPVPCVAPPATASVLDDSSRRPHIFSMLSAGTARWRAQAALGLTGLARTIDSIGRLKARCLERPEQDEAVVTAAWAFHQATLLAASHDRCLATSIALARKILTLGRAPDLVFGVMVQPFRAHCWVQLDGKVLSDRLESVRAFTPILAI